jgi:hypothetical protein
MRRRIGLSAVPIRFPSTNEDPPRTRLPIVTTLLQKSVHNATPRSVSGQDSAATRGPDRRGSLLRRQATALVETRPRAPTTS